MYYLVAAVEDGDAAVAAGPPEDHLIFSVERVGLFRFGFRRGLCPVECFYLLRTEPVFGFCDLVKGVKGVCKGYTALAAVMEAVINIEFYLARCIGKVSDG